MLEPSEFQFTAALEANLSTFMAEFAQLSREDFIANPCHGGYEGAWLILPLFFDTFASGFEPHFPVNQAKCPKTTAALQSIPGVISGGFSWLDPGSRIIPHTDTQPPEVVRAHLGLQIPKQTQFQSGADRCEWSIGKCVVFDGLVEHAATNESDEPRVVLFADSRLEGTELEYLVSTRR